MKETTMQKIERMVSNIKTPPPPLPGEEGKKYDTGKPRWDLLPPNLIALVVDVYTEGSIKYGPNQWQNLPDGYNRYKAALFRHLHVFECGQTKDPETGCYHLAQVVWNALAMLYFSLKEHDNGKHD